MEPGSADEPPIAFMGLNILVEWGPSSGSSPKKPDERQITAAAALYDALDALVSPLAARMIVPIPGGIAPSAEPTTSPGPSAKPTKTP